MVAQRSVLRAAIQKRQLLKAEYGWTRTYVQEEALRNSLSSSPSSLCIDMTAIGDAMRSLVAFARRERLRSRAEGLLIDALKLHELRKRQIDISRSHVVACELTLGNLARI